MTAVVNIKDKPTPAYDLYIGRANKWLGLEGSKWGNPFPMKKESEREDVLMRYEEHIRNSKRLWRSLPELRSKILGCYCFPRSCHGMVLIKLLDEYDRTVSVPQKFIDWFWRKWYLLKYAN